MSNQLDVKRSFAGVPAATDVWNVFRRQVDDLFDNFSDGFQSFALKPFADLEQSWLKTVRGFAPLAVDVAESDQAYTITAEIPGVSEKDVSISNGTLTIKGEKHREREEKAKDHYLAERSYGSFQRMFGLPPGTDESRIEAQVRNGVLSITVPKNAGAPNARKVDVKAA